MRKHAILAFVFCAGPAAAQDGPQSALHRFMAAYNATDPAAMAALFRPDATFYGSSEPELLRGQEEVRGYFVRAWPAGARRSIECDPPAARELTPTVAVVSAMCRALATRPDGQQESRGLRLMGAVVRDADGGWRFADLHASRAAAPRPQ